MTKEEKQPKSEEANPPTDTLEEGTEQGYLGSVEDPAPNEAYTVEGVTSDPEPSEERIQAGEPAGTPEGEQGKPDPEATGKESGGKGKKS